MDPIKTLLLFREGQHHDFPTNAATLRAFLTESGEFDVTATGDFSILASPQLDSYDLILNFTFNHEIDAAEEDGLLAFVANGKGLLGLHTATITFPRSTGYKDLIGGWLDGHAPYGPFPVTITDKHHPVTAGLSDFTITDELYACTCDPSIKVLATAQWKDKDHPMVWTKPYGKGRVCYVALGHDAAAFADATFRRLVCQASAWAAGRRPTRFYPVALYTADSRPARTYRAAIVGSGNIARNHVQGYKGVAGIEVTGAYDIKPDRLTWFKEQTGIDHLYSDLLEMVRKERPDLVSVCTWPDSHCDLVVKLAESGVVKGILCEKPMAIDMGQARKMIDVCDRHHVKLAINHQRRFYSHHQKAKDLIDSGALGTIRKLWASVTTFYKDPYVWATHVTDMIRFYAGDVESIMGQISQIEPQPAQQGRAPLQPKRHGLHEVHQRRARHLRFRDQPGPDPRHRRPRPDDRADGHQAAGERPANQHGQVAGLVHGEARRIRLVFRPAVHPRNSRSDRGHGGRSPAHQQRHRRSGRAGDPAGRVRIGSCARPRQPAAGPKGISIECRRLGEN